MDRYPLAVAAFLDVPVQKPSDNTTFIWEDGSADAPNARCVLTDLGPGEAFAGARVFVDTPTEANPKATEAWDLSIYVTVPVSGLDDAPSVDLMLDYNSAKTLRDALDSALDDYSRKDHTLDEFSENLKRLIKAHYSL